jgi:hypothetical protein
MSKLNFRYKTTIITKLLSIDLLTCIDQQAGASAGFHPEPCLLESPVSRPGVLPCQGLPRAQAQPLELKRHIPDHDTFAIHFPEREKLYLSRGPRRDGGLHRIPALHCTAPHCTALHCTALHCTALHCTALTGLHRNPSPRPILCSRLRSAASWTHSLWATWATLA